MTKRLSEHTDSGTVVFDLDGVLYRGQTAVPGAGEALTDIETAGFQLLFATNNASATPTSVIEKIRRLTGYHGRMSAVVTSGMAAARFIAGRYDKILVVGEPGLRETIQTADVEVVDADSQPDAVVVGLDEAFTYDKLHNASRAIRSGAAFVATNTDATFPRADGQAPGAGSIVAAVATASGVQPVVCGKPEQPMIDILNELAEGEPIWMVGDRPETDIAIAAAAGWRSVLTLTGVVSSLAEVGDGPRPDHVVASIADVPGVVLG